MLVGNVVNVSDKIVNDDSKYYMKYGAGRRLNIFFYAYRHIIFNASAERERPLDTEEARRIMEAINSIYIHTKGTFDNFAWSLLYDVDPDKAKSISKTKVDLFRRDFLDYPQLMNVKEVIASYWDWNAELKSRRDPVAHRIPLTVPPSIVTKDEGQKYGELMDEFLGASKILEFDKAEEIHREIDSIGTFVPFIVHHPNEPHDPLYPTLPEDMGNLIKITRAVLSYFEQ